MGWLADSRLVNSSRQDPPCQQPPTLLCRRLGARKSDFGKCWEMDPAHGVPYSEVIFALDHKHVGHGFLHRDHLLVAPGLGTTTQRPSPQERWEVSTSVISRISDVCTVQGGGGCWSATQKKKESCSLGLEGQGRSALPNTTPAASSTWNAINFPVPPQKGQRQLRQSASTWRAVQEPKRCHRPLLSQQQPRWRPSPTGEV